MAFCREFHMTPTEYLAQPADVLLGWRQYLQVEAEARDVRRRIDEAGRSAR